MPRNYDSLCRDNTKAKWKSREWRLLINITLCSEIEILEYSQINIDLPNIIPSTSNTERISENLTFDMNSQVNMYKKYHISHQIRPTESILILQKYDTIHNTKNYSRSLWNYIGSILKRNKATIKVLSSIGMKFKNW